MRAGLADRRGSRGACLRAALPLLALAAFACGEPGERSGVGAGRPFGSAGGDGAASNAGPDTRSMYLELMIASLLDLVYEDDPRIRAARQTGEDFPTRAYTMIGAVRLANIRTLGEDLFARGVPGDFIEAGAWRGGATIFMRALLKAHGEEDRLVWVADSFEGLPRPNPEKYPADRRSPYHKWDFLAVSVDEVRRNFGRYGLLDDRVRFLKGWFKDTLPDAPIERLAMLRIDADMYESTTDALRYLYPKLSSGGYAIVDDYCIEACAASVRDFRAQHGIEAEIETIDRCGIYWRKP